jgi:hypothetical protein
MKPGTRNVSWNIQLEILNKKIVRLYLVVKIMRISKSQYVNAIMPIHAYKHYSFQNRLRLLKTSFSVSEVYHC